MPDCLLFATADWDAPCWTNKQHTSVGLSEAGFRVLYVESVGLRAPHLGSGRDLRRLWRRLGRSLKGAQKARPGIWTLSPLQIPFGRRKPWIQTANRLLLKAWISRALAKLRFSKPLVWTYHPFMLGSLPRDVGKIVYHCVDDLAAIPGVDQEAFQAAQDRLLARANAVFTTALSLQQACAHKNAQTHFFPNVADLDHFLTAHDDGPVPEAIRALPHPRIGYVGVLSDFKVDFALLDQVCRARPDWHWVLIGEEREGQADPSFAALRALPNVHALGHRPYDELPACLRGLDVATLPTLINAYTRAMFPMKYFEYLAAGLPIVATPLDFTATHRAGLALGRDGASFVDALARQIERGRFSREESIALVGENTWKTRLEKMLALVQAAP